MDVRVRTPIGRKSAWWQVAGKTCVAAYKANGVASLAASYVNLANPGTYDAAPGVEPTLTADGWQFDGSTQKLILSNLKLNRPLSMLIAGSQAGASAGGFLWTGGTAYEGVGFGLGSTFSAANGYVVGVATLTGWLTSVSVANIAGFVLAITFGAGGSGSVASWTSFLNGSVAASNNSGVNNTAHDFIIGKGGSYTSAAFTCGSVALYSDTLTEGEVSVVSAAMAAL